MLPDSGLYVHFPWCVKKCPYCDFNSHPLKEEHDFDAYTEALLADFASQNLNGKFATVFFGGGTPSLFAPQHFARLIEKLPLEANAEITMEANPGTTEHADFAEYLDAGINRLSIGAQSFDNASLTRLGRIHARDEIVQTYRQAVDAGFANINLDLMWGLPEQTLENCRADLETACSLAPQHLSWYQLTIEPKTEFARRPPVLPVEDQLLEMESQGLALLEQHGYTRYEVSAFARDGKRCRHNLNYWQFGDYVGLGAGAHGKITHSSSVVRTAKPHQPRLFLTDPTSIEKKTVAAQDLVFEFMLNALRLVEGVSFDHFSNTTGFDADLLAPRWQRLVDQGLVEAEHIVTTPLGFRYLDSVVAEFIPAT